MFVRNSLRALIVCSLAVLVAAPSFAAAVVPPSGTYTLVALPDTQIYAQDYPEIFVSQTQWIVDNKTSHNIQYVMGLGDITNRNTVVQWDNAKAALSLLDDEVPYALCTGNHDYGTSGKADNRTSYFNDSTYFGRASEYGMQSTVHFYENGRSDNSYHTFTMGDQDWMILSLEFGPRDATVDWAEQVVESHPDHQVIIITHSYMYNEEIRNDHILTADDRMGSPYKYPVAALPGGVNDGQDLYEKLIVDNSNIFMALSGHIGGDGTGYRETIREDGSVVHEMLIDFQFDDMGGNGYLRLFEFLPDGNTVNVRSYSPYVDAYDMDPDQDFTITVFDRPVDRNPTQAVLNDSPLAFYRLQTNDSTVNLGSTASDNDGTYSGTGPTTADFDGDATDQIAIGTFDEMTEWSITAWARPNQVSTRQTVVSNDQNGSNDDVLFGLAPDGYGNATTVGHWSVSHHDDDTSHSTVVEASATAVAGQWYHLTATCDGDTMRLYVDGYLAGEVEKTGNDLDWGATMTLIGRSFNTADGGRPFDGTIGEVAIYDSVLSTSDLETQRLSAFNRVVGGNFVIEGETRPAENIVEDYSIPQQSYPGLSPLDCNCGDYQIVIGDRPGYGREGVLFATVSQNLRDGYRGSAEVFTTLSDCVLSIAWFPFSAGWKGGLVFADGSVPVIGHDMETTTVTKSITGRYVVDMPVDSRSDGMFFTIGANNANHITSTHINQSGNGWVVDVQKNTGDDLREDADFNFLYIPYDSENLIGGQYDGYSGQHINSVGDFTMTRLINGKYQLSIDGESAETGMLILELLNISQSENNLLTYEASGDDFLIESRALGNLLLDDAQFYWAFVSFYDPLALASQPLTPGDANGDGVVDGSDVTILANNWQHGVDSTADATWEMGDFNGDGMVDGSDVTILANNWQYGVTAAAAAVPEPSTLTLLFALGAFLSIGLGIHRSKNAR